MISKVVCLLCFLSLLSIQYNLVFVSGKIWCIRTEREALLEFKRGFVADEYGRMSSWGSQDEKKECCNWDGVQCSNTTGHVIGLQLYMIGVRGEISPALLQLHHLTSLYLPGWTNFGGSRIPEFIGFMKGLRHLSLVDCNLSGVVGQQLGNLTNLVTLDLEENQLRFENLNWVSNLSTLTHLDLSHNNVSDVNWPQQILMLHSLKDLSLSNCQLTDGTTPSKGLFVNSSSTSLSSIDLSSNHLTFATLDWLFNIRSLVYIDLSSNQLDGIIPDSVRNLTILKSLKLPNNKLKGGIPKSLGNLSHLRILDLSQNELRELIGNLSWKVLEHLYLDNNLMSGTVPVFSSCVQLRRLSLENNNLKGLPRSFAQLPKLEFLDISNNSLEGTISDATLVKLHNLKTLDLSFNEKLHITPIWNPPFQLESLCLTNLQLGPQFPTWLQTLRNLTRLDLSYTGISDEMPRWFWNFSTTLSVLKISNNEISGTIPDIYLEDLFILDVSSNVFFGSLPLFPSELHVLQLSQNKFSGSITSICELHILHSLDVSNNRFLGELPNCWKNMAMLWMINLGDNNFSGKIPHSLGSLQRLKLLHLDNNNFSGELPSTLKNCQNLQLIDVGGNKLTGNIPKWIGASYTNMQYLIFRDNRFFGNIPREICNLTMVQVLDLSMNNLSGRVHTCFNTFISLVEMDETTSDVNFTISESAFDELDLNYNMDTYTESAYLLVQWKGKQLEYQKNLKFLKLIDLSSNNLVGNIPREVFHLKGLVSLNLSRNNLEGNIPPNIGNMEKLESLDLSRNHLCGTLPMSLAQLHYLQVLDLSHNHFSGKIPTGTQLQSFNEFAYNGNDQLCGPPLALCPRDRLSPPIHSPEENDEEGNGFMSLSFLQDLGISMAFGFIFGFWGLIGSLLLKRSWRIAYFNFFGGTRDWIYEKIVEFLEKFKRS